MKERWVTFDCFGTLVDWHAGFGEILRPFAAARTDELKAAYHRHEAQVQAEKPFRPYKDVLAEALLRGAREIGLSLERPDALPAQWGSMRVFPDVEPALQALRDLGLKLAILTNCDLDLFAQTAKAFREPFDLVLTAEEVRSYKPAHGHFLSFAERTGVSKDDWVHVACSWFHDIAPARELGIKRIWLDRDLTGEDPKTASRRIVSPEEIPVAVKELLPI